MFLYFELRVFFNYMIKMVSFCKILLNTLTNFFSFIISFFQTLTSFRHIMNATTTKYKVHKCSNCPGDTEFFCKSCRCDLCSQCKVDHVEDLKTIGHHFVVHQEKFNDILKQETCVIHPSNVYKNYCEPCKLPICHLYCL